MSPRMLKQGINDLATVNSELTKEWHPTKNGNLLPDSVTAGSQQKVWWQCKEGHEWEARVSSRNKGVGCPYCSNRKVLKGFNDLATTHPDVAVEWHPTKNGVLKPEDVTYGSGKKVWWVCSEGHEYQAIVYSRTKQSRSCPYCFGKRAIVGETDLATTHPNIASELMDKSLQFKLKAGSGKRVWWKCSICNKEWQAVVQKRTKLGDVPGCTECRRRNRKK